MAKIKRYARRPGRPSKYMARQVIDYSLGMRFASQHEHDVYVELLARQQAGEIFDLKFQVKYELIPPKYGPPGPRGGRGTIIERGVNYIADFTYIDSDGALHVLDSKGYRTDAYIIKRKLMLDRYGIHVEEV